MDRLDRQVCFCFLDTSAVAWLNCENGWGGSVSHNPLACDSPSAAQQAEAFSRGFTEFIFLSSFLPQGTLLGKEKSTST